MAERVALARRLTLQAASARPPAKYWLPTLMADTPIAALVETATLRWRIERDNQDQQELWLDHYEGEVGEDFTTTWRFASRPTDSRLPNGVSIPAQGSNPGSSKRLAYPRVIDFADPPVRPERHIIASIATPALGCAANTIWHWLVETCCSARGPDTDLRDKQLK